MLGYCHNYSDFMLIRYRISFRIFYLGVNNKQPSRPSWSGGFCASMKSCIHINADARFQFNCDVVIPDGDLLDPASHQFFIKFSKEGGLLREVILQVVNSLYLFISCGGIDSCFLAKFSEPEDLIWC